MRILYTLLFLTLTLTLKSQTYHTVARGCIGLTNNQLKTKYSNLKFELIDNVPTYELTYVDGSITFILTNAVVTTISFMFHSEEIYNKFISNNEVYWSKVSRGKYEDKRYSHIKISIDVDNNSISMVIVRLNN